MSGTRSSGFGVSISAIDNASKVIDGINKRLAGLSAPAERFNKAVARFGDVSGVNKLGESMGALGSKSLDTFRSLERVSPMLATITGAASLAGMSSLVSRWSQLGNAAALTGQRLGVPTDRLTALQGAARLAGSSAEDLSSGLGSLDEKLRGATFNRDPQAVQMFNALHVAFRNADGSARDAGSAFNDVAEGIKRLNDTGGRGAALRAAQSLNMGDLFPLLVQGREGVQKLMKETAGLGGVISPEAAKRAQELKTSFTELDIAIGGVANRLGDQLGKQVEPYLDRASAWIAKNQEVTDSYAKIGAGILALGAIKPATWLARLLGIGAGTTGFGLAALGGYFAGKTTEEYWKKGLMYDPVTGTMLPNTFGDRDAPQNDVDAAASQWWKSHAPTWLGGSPAPDMAIPRGLRNNNPLNLSFAPGQGAIGSDGRFGIFDSLDDGIAAEERQLLRYQDQGDNTLRKIITRWAPPSENDTEGYIADAARRTGFDADTPLNLRDADQAQRVISAMGWHESGRQIDTRAIQSGVDQGINGQVHVTVTLKGAPAGTTAAAAATGRATVAPPRVETSMPYAGYP